MPILHSVLTSGILPAYGPVNTGNLAGAALKTTRILHNHLPRFFVQGIKVPRAGVNTETLLAVLADILLELYVALLVVLDGIAGNLFFYRFYIGLISQH
jgi:hypothetical protein